MIDKICNNSLGAVFNEIFTIGESNMNYIANQKQDIDSLLFPDAPLLLGHIKESDVIQQGNQKRFSMVDRG